MIQRLRGTVALATRTRLYSTSTAALNADICIIGGGIVGTATAASIGRSPFAQGKKIILIEAGHLFQDVAVVDGIYSNRVSSLTPSSVSYLKDIGAWNAIDEGRKWSYNKMVVWDAVGKGLIDFEKKGDEEGPIATIVENRLIQSSLAHVVASLDSVEVFDCTKVERIEKVNDKPTLKLNTGLEISCDLLVGADGINSKARDYAGIETVGIDYNEWGLVGTVELDTSSSNRTAYQRFLPSGPVALLPLSDTHSSIVWSLKGDLAQRIAKLDDSKFVDLLNAAFHNPHQDIQFLLSSITNDGGSDVDIATEAAWGRDREGVSSNELVHAPWVTNVAEGSRAPFPLRMRHAKEYTNDRVVLIGDAGHTVHPLAGQGLNLGLLDSASLSDTILHAIRAGQDIADPNALSNYAATRYAHNSLMLSACHTLHSLFSNESTVLAKARSLGLGALNQSSIAKSIFMKIAS